MVISTLICLLAFDIVCRKHFDFRRANESKCEMILRIALSVCAALLALSAVVAQDNSDPTIAFLRLSGPAARLNVTELAVVDALEAYGYLTEGEEAALQSRQDFEGERVNVVWGDADRDLAADQSDGGQRLGQRR